MRKLWMHKARSFKEAEKFDREYYSLMSPSERLEAVQFLRENYYKIFPRRRPHAYRKGLRRVLRVTKQK